ncbi:MAG: porin family protein [Bacteroidaceae bacterium]|jgi:hypothetical protein|nr:porin family protein [Bacteroidaceae bacterium]
MKRFFYLFLFFSIYASVSLRAQIGESRSQLSIGGNAGFSFASVDFEPTIKQGQLVCPTVGLTMRYTCEKYFSTVCALQMEVNYMRLGWKESVMNSESQPLPDNYQREIGYVQLPMMARLAWGKEQHGLMFFLLAGPQISLYLGDTSKKSATWTLNASGNPDRPNNVYQQYGMAIERKIDYGLTGGVGMELNTALGHFILEGRYYFGLNDIYNNSKKDVFSRSANRVMIGKVTYLFDLFNQ